MSYTRGLNAQEWSIVEPLLLEYLPKKKRTRPLKWSYREIFDALLYQLRNGCNWRDLPKDFPPYSTVYWHYKQRRESGLIDKWLAYLHEELRRQVKKTSMDYAAARFSSGEEYMSCQCRNKRLLLLQIN